MEIPVRLPGFETQRPVVKTSAFASPQLILRGQPVAKIKGFMRPRNDANAEVAIRFKPRFLDPIPNLEVAGSVVELASPLKWYEYAWMMFPILLIFAGGLLGAMFGVVAVLLSTNVFRSDRPAVIRYALTGAISIASVAGYVVGVTMLLSAIKK
jgi:hypothetical protein